MYFIFEQIRTGGDRNFGYLVGDRKTQVAAVIDPSYDPAAMVARAKEQELHIQYIINTHGHGDHTNGNVEVKALSGAPVAAFKDSDTRPDIPLDDGAVLTLGPLSLETIHVPGHTDDHIIVYLREQRVCMTGDHLFVGKIGGTGTDTAARREHQSLVKTLARLPDDVTIWPGHDYGCRPSSTVALEKLTNPFLQRLDDIDAFLQLKRDWADFKARHGLR